MSEATRDAIRGLLDKVDTSSAAAITDAAELVLESVAAGGIVHVAGAGHSLVMVCETFYRAGGLAAVRPVWDPAVLPLTGARRSTRVEREEGVGREVVRAAAPAPPDIMVVFSTSGRNPYPVEIAQECAHRGVPVIAVTSIAASERSTPRANGSLAEHATIVLDTGVPPGDIVHPPDAPRTSPVSTILGAYVWSVLLAELDELAAARGHTLPRWTSANIPGGDEANAEFMARYGDRIPEL
ncbi:MAG: sugar isomerase domain-containing protein [Pseudonocardiaceae bacterium]|nr:sugar isomerase domain-containing protein [Pseudonocardiaceae bacterium]